MAKKPIAQQVVVVVGASSGVGRATARLAGVRGAKVVVAARNGEALENAVREIEDAGSEALAVTADVTSEVDCETVVSRTLDRFGRIDTVVASAFTSVYAEIDDTELDELRRVMDVNFLGRVRCLRAALPALTESRGTFIDVNSALAYRGIPLQASYCASKAASRTWLEAARVELEKRGSGVDLCAVLPGAINTPHFVRVRQKTGLHPMPVPPIYQPEVVAAAILRLAERPVRELPVTWGGQKVLWGQKVAPRALDLFLRQTAWKSQTTGEPKSTNELDNLYDTLRGDPGAHGPFDEQSRTSSAWTRVRQTPGMKLALAAAGAALPVAAAAVARRRS